MGLEIDNGEESVFLDDKNISLSVCLLDMMKEKDYWAGELGDFYTALSTYCHDREYFPVNTKVLGRMLNSTSFKDIINRCNVYFKKHKILRGNFLTIWKNGFEDEAKKCYEEVIGRVVGKKERKPRKTNLNKEVNIPSNKEISTPDKEVIIPNKEIEVINKSIDIRDGEGSPINVVISITTRKGDTINISIGIDGDGNIGVNQ